MIETIDVTYFFSITYYETLHSLYAIVIREGSSRLEKCNLLITELFKVTIIRKSKTIFVKSDLKFN